MGVHNPYHFVPVFPRTANHRADDLATDDLKTSDRVTHAKYVPGTFSGEVHCQVTASTPFLIGSTKGTGFTIGGRPALPASSLRGLISHVAETASESALRVLGREVNGEPCYAFRTAAADALSAIGRLRRTSTGAWMLEPVTLPQLPCNGPTIYLDGPHRRWRSVFHDFERPPLRVYISPGSHRTWNRTEEDFWSLPLARLVWADSQHSAITDPSRSIKLTAKQAISQTANPVDQQPERFARPDWTRGVVRVLGCHRDGMFPNKHWELFLPYQPDDTNVRGTWLPIPAGVIDKYQMLADQRTDATKDRLGDPILPFEPLNTRPARARKRLTPEDGDLVYFDVDPTGAAVTEISYSAIWRRRVETPEGEAANAWHFFAGVDPDLVPVHAPAPDLPPRSGITIGERLFGFVEDRSERDSATGVSGLALRGKLRFSDGVPQGVVHFASDRIELRVLNTPKPPAPAMYFKTADPNVDAFIAKSSLSPGLHWPQGRKYYLHQKTGGDPTPWVHDHDRDGPFDELMQQRIRPLAAGSTFVFRIRFDNLSRPELALLLYSLKPAEHFLHKLGMGKSVGLGAVDIRPTALLLVDRARRYSADGWLEPRDRDATADIPALIQEWRDQMRVETRRSLEALGDPAGVRAEVQTPRTAHQEADRRRTETYEWFVANERVSRRNLKALERNGFEIPELPDL